MHLECFYNIMQRLLFLFRSTEDIYLETRLSQAEKCYVNGSLHVKLAACPFKELIIGISNEWQMMCRTYRSFSVTHNNIITIQNLKSMHHSICAKCYLWAKSSLRYFCRKGEAHSDVAHLLVLTKLFYQWQKEEKKKSWHLKCSCNISILHI